MSRSVVIVDDNAGFRASAGRVLRDRGYVIVAEAADGVAGVEAALELRPDIAIVDVQLPDIDGFEVTRLINRRGLAPAVVLTSSRDRADFGKLVEGSDARGFVPKAELTADALEALIP